MTAFGRKVRETDYHEYVSARIFIDEFQGKHLQARTKEDINTLEEATEVYVVEVIAESHC